MSTNEFIHRTKVLSEEEVNKLEHQNTRLVSDFQAKKLENDAKKNWDLFYKRNETRFFKDRHWTTREFQELLNDSSITKKYMLEVGCGVGNLIYPLIEDKLNNYFIYACDISDRAVDLVKCNILYDENYVKCFQADITTPSVFVVIPKFSLDIVTMIFVLSAIHPDKFSTCLKNMYDLLKPGGVVLFRDYGLYDMAQLRFKPGHKISDNFYMRQDGTRSYYFSEEYLAQLFIAAGYEVIENSYIHRRTINQKEHVDVPRIFVQGKFRKPEL